MSSLSILSQALPILKSLKEISEEVVVNGRNPFDFTQELQKVPHDTMLRIIRTFFRECERKNGTLEPITIIIAAANAEEAKQAAEQWHRGFTSVWEHLLTALERSENE
jgi:hypothetical protein